MVKIEITETGQTELDKIGFNIEESLNKIIVFIPKEDLVDLGHIIVTDKPHQSKKHLDKALGAYSQKHENIAAYIEIYITRLFAHLKSAESLRLMIPLQNIGLAETLFHEVGHHVEKIRSHGINKKTREKFAEKYASRLLSIYLDKNAESIDECFKNLEKIADEKGLSKEIIDKMKAGWKEQFQELSN
jgi:hypothetical protein